MRVALLAAALVAMVAGCGGQAAAVNEPSRNEPAKNRPEPAVAWKGDAFTLCGSDSTGLVGQWIEVVGDVSSVDLDPNGPGGFVYLQGDGYDIWRVCCYLRNVGNPVPAGTVTIRGRLRQGGSRSGVQLSPCKLVR